MGAKRGTPTEHVLLFTVPIFVRFGVAVNTERRTALATDSDGRRFMPCDQPPPHRTVQDSSLLWTVCEPCGLNFRGYRLLASLQSRQRVLRLSETGLDP